jgi:hypothetical protein
VARSLEGSKRRPLPQLVCSLTTERLTTGSSVHSGGNGRSFWGLACATEVGSPGVLSKGTKHLPRAYVLTARS